MRLPEQRFWDRTKRALSPHLHLERIENLVAVGRPDVDVLAPNGRFTPMELKAVTGLPALPSTRVLGRVGLSQDQKNWHLAWRQAGGRSAILIGIGGNQQLLIPGRYHDSVNELSYAALLLAAEAQTWPDIIRVLTEGWKE